MSTKEKPIIFGGPMVRAILAGAKTQTRRACKLTGPYGNLIRLRSPYAANARDGVGLVWTPHAGATEQPMPAEEIGRLCPYGGPGDRLWVREAWAYGWLDGREYREAVESGEGCPIFYQADWTDERVQPSIEERWRSPIHMPRRASRITLEIQAVRVERLQAITEDDAIAEGVDSISIAEIRRQAAWSRRQDFSRIWDKINGAGAWEADPWVFVIEFRRVREEQG